jgi:GNAT superfamily N-acetyltransferase
VSVRFAIGPLAKVHKRADFTCGNDRIGSYFRETVSPDVTCKYAICFMAREIATDRVAGFYTLSPSTVPLNEVPEPLAKKPPRYPTVPAVLIGWLGRHSDYAGQGLGEALLFDAIKTVATAPIGAHAIFADVLDDGAAAFYTAFGFTPLVRRPHTLYLPVTTASSLLSP